MISKEKIQWEINQQVAELNACRQAMKQSTQKVRKTIASPSVLCGGAVIGFLVSYFFISKRQISVNTVSVSKKSSFGSRMNTVFSSPLFLLAVALLKNKLK